MRESGILMPVSSLPGPYGIGCFGAENVGFHIGSEAVRMDTSVPMVSGPSWYAMSRTVHGRSRTTPARTRLGRSSSGAKAGCSRPLSRVPMPAPISIRWSRRARPTASTPTNISTGCSRSCRWRRLQMTTPRSCHGPCQRVAWKGLGHCNQRDNCKQGFPSNIVRGCK